MKSIDEIAVQEKDLRFLREAYQYAWTYSQNPSTATGAVIVKNDRILVWGANCAPEGVILTPDILACKLRDEYLEHAERAAISKAARMGVPLYKSTMYSPWFPCAPCMRAIANAGIVELVTHKEFNELSAKVDEKWKDSQLVAQDILKQTGIKHRDVSARIGDYTPIRFKGNIYYL